MFKITQNIYHTYFVSEQPRTAPQQDLLTVYDTDSPHTQEEEPPDLLEYPQTSSTVISYAYVIRSKFTTL